MGTSEPLFFEVIDCIVSEWSPWSKCDSACGPGMASRNRTIRQRPQNGGKHCPSLVQKRACPGTDRDCRHGRRLLPQLQETALLLPVMPAPSRQINAETNDIGSSVGHREELWKDTFHHKRESTKGYCVAFEVMKVTKQCHKEPNYHALAEGDRVVVRCDLVEPTPPLNATSSSASASDDDEPSSTSTMNNSISSDESSDGDDDEGADDVGDDDGEADYNESSSSSINSRTGSNKVEQRPPNRCLGEGLTGRNTRFASLAIPACHGKWLRLTVGVPKKCTPGEAQFIFV
ncbi:hypothetical protein pipiens_014127 [Culex pipiens pipiens]|uniref:Spondin-like TSP1 domain-containing protein n=1 Tax=Culex pipiens pipiens TaxID=38569 RepID=A0ABD1CVQ7_CULPP